MNPYELFYSLHQQEKPFILGNAWNVKSAQLLEQSGFQAIGTSSGAISNSLGYDDGEKMPFSQLLFLVQRITACTNIPVSVDIERGYTNDDAVLIANIQSLLDAGVAGINIEDSLGEEALLQKLYTIKHYLHKTNQQLFINARTDGFLQKVSTPLERTIQRAAMYREAGADGLFVTGIADQQIIQSIASAISMPLNVVATPALSSFITLATCGVKRISMAVQLYNAAYRHAKELANQIQAEQSAQTLFPTG